MRKKFNCSAIVSSKTVCLLNRIYQNHRSHLNQSTILWNLFNFTVAHSKCRLNALELVITAKYNEQFISTASQVNQCSAIKISLHCFSNEIQRIDFSQKKKHVNQENASNHHHQRLLLFELIRMLRWNNINIYSLSK